jgi:gluconate 2-dehydrogenase gamma chain
MEPEKTSGLLCRPITRRRFLIMSGATVGALAIGGAGLLSCAEETGTDTTTHAGGPHTSEGHVQPLTTLSVAQASLLAAVVSRLIPADDLGPSAAEAGVVGYIDQAIREEADRGATFLGNLNAVQTYALDSAGEDFVALAADKQDTILKAVESGEATGFVPNSFLFFLNLRNYTLQGMFGDPYYGGNRDFAGWKLIGFPGIRFTVTEDDQKLDFRAEPVNKSAYDYGEFGFAVQGG